MFYIFLKNLVKSSVILFYIQIASYGKCFYLSLKKKSHPNVIRKQASLSSVVEIRPYNEHLSTCHLLLGWFTLGRSP